MAGGDLLLIERTLRTLEQLVRRVDAEGMTGRQAAQLGERLARAERLCSAAKAVCARRVAETKVYRDRGHRSAASWLAETSGESVGQASQLLDTATRIAPGSAVEEAFRGGRLSPAQAKEIASAVEADPKAEQTLLESVEHLSLPELKAECRSIRSAAMAEADKRRIYERIRASRYHRSWTDDEGAYCYRGRTTADDGARIMAALQAETSHLFREARKSGRSERIDACAVDALVRTLGVKSTGAKKPPTMLIRVDAAALQRGATEGQELCEIDGVGPVPLATARRYLPDAFLKVVITRGRDVQAICHIGRFIPASLRSALEARDPRCVVPGCNTAYDLQLHHIVPVEHGGPTSMANMCRVCAFHHFLITNEGFAVSGKPAAWRWREPVAAPP